MITDAHKTQRMALALTFFKGYHKDGDEFPNHIVQVTGEETWVSYVNVETKEQSKKWMHTHSPNKPRKFEQMFLPARKRKATFLGQERCTEGGIHATRDHSNVRSVL
jgi:hypothetical protein